MNFTEVFVRRPVFATAMSLLLLAIGILSLTKMELRQFPEIDASVIQVQITYPGASPSLMEGFVSTPVEAAIAGIDGVDYMTSASKQNASIITVYMKLGYDIDKALINVSNQVSSVRSQLPKDILDPVISKQDPNATAIIWLSFTSDKMSPGKVSDYLLRVVQPELVMQEGVGSAEIISPALYSMRIWLNPQLMAGRGISGLDIQNAIYNYNVQSAAGTVKGTQHQYQVVANTDLNTAKEFNDIPLKVQNGQVVRIKDIGNAELGGQNNDISINVNGKDAVLISITPKSNANPLAVADAIKAQLPNIRAHLPDGVHMSMLWDQSIFITASINDVRHTIIEAGIFVFIVIFLMLGSFRSVFVPIVTIPLSIIGGCSIMFALGFSINTLTLLAFVLAIGLVVDDAIVVLENIHRHLEEGLTPFKAALVGAQEISFAIIAMTLTLAAVYAPIGFAGGLTGKLFTEFAFTLAGSVLVSGFIALTLSPMMCSKIYRKNEDLHGGFQGVVNRVFERMTKEYKKLLHLVIQYRYLVCIFALVIYVFAYLMYAHIPKQLAPDEDQGGLIAVFKGPSSANVDYVKKITDNVSQTIFTKIPELDDYFVVNGYPNTSSALSFLAFKPWDQRKRSAMQIQTSLQGPLWSIPGVIAFPANFPPLPGSTSYSPVQFVLKTTEEYPVLEKYLDQMKKTASAWGGLVNIDSDLKIDQPQTNVVIERDKANDLNISNNEIAAGLSISLGQPITTYFNMQGRSYEVLPQLYQEYRSIPDKLNNLNVKTMNGQLVPLSNIAEVEETVTPRELDHFQELRSATITANLAPGYTQGTAYDYLQNLANTTLPKTIQTDVAGQLRQFIQESGRMGQTFLFAIIFIYLILAAQFESFRDPLIVMLSVPLSIAGALFLLMLFGGTINIYTEIGLITLVGLITKNGILIVEFANQQQEKGKEILEAIVDGASMRLRPILMTTCCMILGGLPLAMSWGAGGVSRRQIGLVIVGGMSFGTLLTLFVVPVAYYLFATKINKKEAL